MGNKFGSVWNKWDFHVHTPYSILHNEYGFNPFETTEEENEKYFDKNLKNCTKSESGEAVDGQAEENVVRWMKDGKSSNSGEC